MVRMDENMPFLLQYEHVAWYDNGKVRILDRRVYPTEVRFVECVTYQEVVQAIADMVTQSAGPYTAVGMGMALAAWQVRDKGAAEQDAFLQQAAYDLAHARPTTANRYGQITYRCAEVAKEALAEAAMEVCGKSDGVLLGNHGLVCCGKDIKGAYGLACNLEYIAEIQCRAMSIGKPNVLTEEQMAEVMVKFQSYGQPGAKKTGY